MTLDDLGDRLFAYVPEVAQILGRDERTVRAAIKAGQIPATKAGQRYIVRVSWLREQAGAPAPPASAAVPDLDELADRVADQYSRDSLDFSPEASAVRPALLAAITWKSCEMPRRNARAVREGPPRDDRGPGQDHEPRTPVTVAPSVDELAPRRELRSWASAAAWLNQQGFAAAVPGHLVGALRRRGLVVWAAGDREAA